MQMRTLLFVVRCWPAGRCLSAGFVFAQDPTPVHHGAKIAEHAAQQGEALCCPGSRSTASATTIAKIWRAPSSEIGFKVRAL